MKQTGVMAVGIILVAMLVAFLQSNVSGFPVDWAANSTPVAQRIGGNFIGGTGIDVTGVDDLANQQVDFTIDNTAIGVDTLEDSAEVVSGSTDLNFGAGFDLVDNGSGESGIGLDLSELTGVPASMITLPARKGSSGTIPIFAPVYVTGFNVDQNAVEVEAADAGNAATMPAVGVATGPLTNSANGTILMTGEITAVDTSVTLFIGSVPGDPLYVAVGGGFTNIKPTGTALVQKLAEITRTSAGAGQAIVFGAGRTNDLPNIPSGDFWMGNGSAVPTGVTMSGDVTNDNAGVITIQPDSVALTTDTTGNYAAGDAEAGNATGVACTDCVTLTAETVGNYVASLVAGTGIDVGAAAEGGTPTIDFDSTEIGSTIWGSGSSIAWSFDNSPTLSSVSGDITLSPFGDVVITNGKLLHINDGSSGATPRFTQGIRIEDNVTNANALEFMKPAVGAGEIVWSFADDSNLHSITGYGGSHATLPDTVQHRVGGALQLNWTDGRLDFQKAYVIDGTTSITFNGQNSNTDVLFEADDGESIMFLDANNSVTGHRVTFGSTTPTAARSLFVLDWPSHTTTNPFGDDIERMIVDSTGAISLGGDVTSFTTLSLSEPNFLLNGNNAVNGVTLWIKGAPTEAILNYAVWSDAGLNRFDGAIVGSTGAGFILTSGLLDFQEAATIGTTAGNLTLDPAGNVVVAGDINPEADGTRDLGIQTTAQWANVWSDLINGADYSYVNGWRTLEAEKYQDYPEGIAIGNTYFTDGVVTDVMPPGAKPVFVVTEDFIEFQGVRISADQWASLAALVDGRE